MEKPEGRKVALRRPWFKFWPGDWRGDAKLSVCSLAARGLWIELCAVMHEGTPYGHARFGGVAMDALAIAAVARAVVSEVPPLLAELERNGVLSRTEDGTIFSRRMVRDEEQRTKGREDKLRGLSVSYPSRVPSRDPSTRAEPLSEARSLSEITSSSSEGSSDSENQTRARASKNGAHQEHLVMPGQRKASQAQRDGEVSRGAWERGWLEVKGTPWKGWSGARRGSVRNAYVRLDRDEALFLRAVEAWLANPAWKHRENPDPVAFIAHLDSVVAALGSVNGSAPRRLTEDQKNQILRTNGLL